MTTHRPPQLAHDPSITPSPRRALPLRAVLVVALLAAGCEGVGIIRPYKMDIQQGNVVTQEMVARLQPGMTRAQVRFTLGTPLVVDPFRTDRWDYVYLLSRRGVVTEQRRIVVVFKDDRLARVEGDVMPAGDGRAGWDARPPATSGAHAAQQTER